MAHESRRPAGNRDGAAASDLGIAAVNDSPDDIVAASVLTAGGALICAGCGLPGRPATIAADDPRPVLRVVFRGDPPRAELACELCRAERPPATTRREVVR